MDAHERDSARYVVIRYVAAIKCQNPELAQMVHGQGEAHVALHQAFDRCIGHLIENTGFACDKTRMFVSISTNDGLPTAEDIPQLGERDEGKESPT